MFLVWWNIFSTILWAVCCLIKPTDSFLLILFFIDITKNLTCIYTLIFFFYFLISFATCLVARCLFYKVIFFDTIKIFSYLWVSWDIILTIWMKYLIRLFIFPSQFSITLGTVCHRSSKYYYDCNIQNAGKYCTHFHGSD